MKFCVIVTDLNKNPNPDDSDKLIERFNPILSDESHVAVITKNNDVEIKSIKSDMPLDCWVK